MKQAWCLASSSTDASSSTGVRGGSRNLPREVAGAASCVRAYRGRSRGSAQFAADAAPQALAPIEQSCCISFSIAGAGIQGHNNQPFAPPFAVQPHPLR
jgi:hypothetical protein